MTTTTPVQYRNLVNRAVCVTPTYLRKLKGARQRKGLLSADTLPTSWLLVLMVVFGLHTTMVQGQDTLKIVKQFHKLGPALNSFLSGLGNDAAWATDVAGVGDIDNDGVPDLASGQNTYNGNRGAIWLMFMNADGTVKDTALITNGRNGIPSSMLNIGNGVADGFGGRVEGIGLLDNDNVPDIAVTASGDDDGGTDRGAVYILFMNTDGTVKDTTKISDLKGGFTGTMTGGNNFGGALANMGDVDGDGIQDLGVGSYLSNDGGTARGALWVMLMNRNGTVKGHRKYTSASTNWPGTNPISANNAQFGFSADDLGDIDGDGVRDMAVTARLQGARGYVYILRMNADGTIKAYQQLGHQLGGLKTSVSGNGGHFGWSIECVGDLNADGVNDLIAGLRYQDDGYSTAGAAIILYLNSDGTIQHEEVISQTKGTGGSSLGLRASFSYPQPNFSSLRF